MKHRVGTLLAVALFALLALSCGRSGQEVELEPRFDLVAEATFAEVEAEPGWIDIGTPAARPYLAAGWSADETGAKGDTFSWTMGEEARVVFFLLEPRELRLRFACRPFRFPGAPAQALEVRVGEREVARLELAPKLADYEIVLPADALRAGHNELVLRPTYHRRARDVVPGASDNRSLAIAWHWLAFGAASAETPPLAPRGHEERGLLFVPAGVEIAYHLPIEAGSELAFTRLSTRGGARLEATLEVEGQAPRGLELLEGEESSRRAPLGGEGERQLARLVLRVLPAQAAESVAEPVSANVGVAIQSPRILSPRILSPRPSPPARAERGDREPAPREEGARPPDIIVYLIDTLRADHLGCYSSDRGASPEIDAFATDAVLFEQAVAQSSWTKASVASIFTGLWPRAHGANTRDDKLSAEARTLAELLRDGGYKTAAFVTNPNVTESFGFDQGFDEFHYLGAATNAELLRSWAVDWLDGWLEGRPEPGAERPPFFLYVHSIDPHSPYVPPEQWRRRVVPQVADPRKTGGKDNLDDLQAGRKEVTEAELSQLLALYDAEISFNDHSFGLFLEDLRARGLYDGAFVVLVSDHGEEFYDHGNFTHGRTLHAESLAVPLIVKLPGSARRGRVASPVQHIDLLPTLLGGAGIEPPPGLGGRDLAQLAAAGWPERQLFSFLHLDGPERASVREERWKLIQRIERRGASEALVWPRLYDLEVDPKELDERSAERAVRTGYLATALRRQLAGGATLESEQAIVDESLRESLRALGYVQ